MKKIGESLTEFRVGKNYSRRIVSQKTKIKEEFIGLIEEENWSALPEFAVVLGFVRNIASAVDMPVDKAVALLRRDYPSVGKPMPPKPDIVNKFLWTPRMTFVAGVGVIVVALLGYLVFEYFQFVKPPTLVVSSPYENEVVRSLEIEVIGATDSDATVVVNGQPLVIDQVGSFRQTLEITKETQTLNFEAVSRSGRKNSLVRKIKIEK